MSSRYRAANIIGARTVLIIQSSQDILHIRALKVTSATNAERKKERAIVAFNQLFLSSVTGQLHHFFLTFS
jgi:hypothetical protein